MMKIDEVTEVTMGLGGREVPTRGSPPDARNGYIEVHRIQSSVRCLCYIDDHNPEINFSTFNLHSFGCF